MREGELNWARCEKLLRLYWSMGVSSGNIATLINAEVSLADRGNVDCTRNMVIGKAHRLGLKPRPSPIGKTKDARAAVR